MSKLYDTPPDDKLFEEVREKCMRMWEAIDTDDDKFGYATSKKNRIKDIQNVSDNFMYMIAMFDINNQRALAPALTPEARQAIRERLIDGGQPKEYIVF